MAEVRRATRTRSRDMARLGPSSRDRAFLLEVIDLLCTAHSLRAERPDILDGIVAAVAPSTRGTDTRPADVNAPSLVRCAVCRRTFHPRERDGMLVPTSHKQRGHSSPRCPGSHRPGERIE